MSGGGIKISLMQRNRGVVLKVAAQKERLEWKRILGYVGGRVTGSRKNYICET